MISMYFLSTGDCNMDGQIPSPYFTKWSNGIEEGRAALFRMGCGQRCVYSHAHISNLVFDEGDYLQCKSLLF